MEHVAVVEIDLAKSQGAMGERSDGIGLAAGVDHSSLDSSWDYTLTDLPYKHSHWDSSGVEASHVLGPAHRTVCSSDERDFAKKGVMNFVAVVFHDGEQTRFHWEWEEMQMDRGLCVDIRVDFEAEGE